MKLLFWLFAFLAIYSYAIYPLIVSVWSKIVHRGWKQSDITPSISIIISAYNEEAVIAEKIANTLELDYPPEDLEIIVSSDGSTDRTNEIVNTVEDPRVKLHEFPRSGKSACLNQVVPEAQGEIVLFTDANAMLPADTLRKLVRNFGDEKIGLVTGGTNYFALEGAREVTGIYARLESWTRWHESQVESCVGADGAIFAIRKDLFVPLQENDIHDFVIPLKVIEQGYRVVSDLAVSGQEPASVDDKEAFRRQVQITNRTVWAIARHLRFADPRQYGAFAFFLISHKLLRFGVFFFFLLTGLINLKLFTAGPIYFLIFLAYWSFLILALLSYMQKINHKIADVCKFLLFTIVAQLVGLLRMLVRIEDKTWTPEQ